MKKIKYMRKREEGELDQLRDDEFCGAVMEGLSDDYLSYISNLIKTSKTPCKPTAVKQYNSSHPQGLRLQPPLIENRTQPSVDANTQLKSLASTPHSRPHSIRKSATKPLSSSGRRSSTLQNTLLADEMGGSLPHTEEGRFKSHLTQSNSTEFITSIDHYLLRLQKSSRKQAPFTQASNKRSKKQIREYPSERSRHPSEYSADEVYTILKENLKLKKKVNGYQEKIEDLEEEVSGHLIHCHERDLRYKDKIDDLVKLLSHASSKLNSQKAQMDSMKGLLKSFGKKVKNIQIGEDDGVDISQQLMHIIRPTSHLSEAKAPKHKKGLEATMPRKQEANW